MSSLFQNGLFNSPSANNTSFHPLFRLLDDFEQHQRNTTDNEHPHRQHRVTMRSFTPKFDVKELPDAYELHGDLPGIEQKDVEIEFTDVQTITVRGRTERSYSSGSTPSGLIEGSATPTQAIEGSQNTSADQSHKPAAHKATVQDEDEDNTNTTVTTTSKNSDVTSNKQPEKTEPKAKYWVSERSVGEFSRSFTFPVRVDQEKVTAGMKNGVLTITVPKAKKHEAKRIQISSL